MTKYILKRDLPLANAGIEVELLNYAPNFYRINSIEGVDLGSINQKDIPEWLEDIPEKPKSVFDLNVGDWYYYIQDFDLVEIDCYKGSDIVDIVSYGNVFLTEEEAKTEIARRKAIVKIKKYCWEKGWDMEWKEGEENFSFYYVYEVDKIDIDVKFIYRVQSSIGFPHNKDQGLEILEHFTPELKLILGVN